MSFCLILLAALVLQVSEAQTGLRMRPMCPAGRSSADVSTWGFSSRLYSSSSWKPGLR